MERVLVVEDSLLQGKMLADLLQNNNCEAEVAVSGEAAIEKLKMGRYDLILMDMVLPDFSGIHLIKKIKQVPGVEDLPIIVLSGLTDKENVIESLEMGIHDYITKPYHAKELINRINIHLQLRRTHNKLIQANSANDKFLSVLGHDLKSSFTVLSSAIALLDRPIADEVPRSTILKEARNTSRQVTALLDELLLWGRMMNKGIVQNNERFDFNNTAKTMIGKMEDGYRDKEIQWVDSIEGQALVEGDVNMVVAALRNIISNARKFTARGGQITFTSSTLEEGGRIFHCISIKDTGMGMSPQKVRNLFKSNYHPVEIDADGNRGVGLGLSIAKEFADKNGGKLLVESEEGQGSTFALALPAIV